MTAQMSLFPQNEKKILYEPYTKDAEAGTAHQFLMREHRREEEKKQLSFNDKNLVLGKTCIHEITRNTAKKIIEKYEYLQCMPAITSHHFGITFETDNGPQLGGVLCYGQDYAKNLGVWDKYGYTENMLLLSRGVCLWWTPKNTASYFISRANKWLQENTNYRVITATVDPMAGEVGTIYQALNWYYIGSMRRANPNVKNGSKRFGVLIDGKLYGSRSIRALIGSQRKAEILAKFPDAEFIGQTEKERYFTFLGNKKERKELAKSIDHLIISYPKRKAT